MNCVNGKHVLAKGGYGIIYLVEIHQTLAAMKVLDSVSEKEREAQSEFEQELELLFRLRHPNILLYLGGSTNNELFFLTELMETDLFELIKKKDPRADWNNNGRHFARDIAAALSYLHSKKLVHKDMKSGNILINRSTAKLADFGLTKTVEEKNNRLTIDRAFSAAWASPEQINPNTTVSYPTDVYSFAIVIWEILTGKQPWDNVGTFQLLTATAAGEFKKWHPTPKNTIPELDLMLAKCWFAEPDKRPTAEMCLLVLEGFI
uniref:Protein kinase domain-containing protein n=1 Tax=Arcella intermedia TaxID=1963864 RepID=A0A6B2LEQ7_9EUKA